MAAVDFFALVADVALVFGSYFDLFDDLDGEVFKRPCAFERYQRDIVEVRMAREVMQVGLATEFLPGHTSLFVFGEFLRCVSRCFQAPDFALDGFTFFAEHTPLFFTHQIDFVAIFG